MPKFLRKLLFEKESYNGDHVFYWLGFKNKLYITLLIFLVGLILLGVVILSGFSHFRNELSIKNNLDRQLDEVWQLKSETENIRALSVAAIRNKNTLEVEDILAKKQKHISKLLTLNETKQNLSNLLDANEAFTIKLKYYSIFNMDIPQYKDFKKVYLVYLNELNDYEQYLNKQMYGLKMSMKEMAAPLTIEIFLLLIIVIATGWLMISALQSIIVPAKLISGYFRQDSPGPAIPIYSHEGLGEAGIYLNEGLKKWKMISIDIRGMIGKFDHFCQQLIAEVRLREITEVQLQEIYTAIEAYFNDQNKVIKQSNEQLKFLADNFANLQKIPSQLTQIYEQLRKVVNTTKTKSQEVLDISFEFRDESGRISNLFKDLVTTLDQVNHVMTVLQEVAEQTELLSFNTAIEAAKAGEKGLGFGVISKEISKIVVRSRKTSESLKQLIGEIQEKSTSINTVLPKATFSKDIATGIIESTSGVCVGIFETAAVCMNNIIKLTEVLEDIYYKSSELAPDADLISGITSSEEEDLKNIELKILDYQLNVKQEVREAEKLNEAVMVLRQYLAS